MKSGEKKVLVVESSRALSTAYCNCLKKGGYAPVLVESGQAALGELAAEGADFDVVLLDLNLPDIEGQAMMSRLAEMQHAPGRKPAVVAMTVQGAARSAADAMSHGAVDVILKPFDEETLSRTMKRALSYAVRGDTSARPEAIVQDGLPGQVSPQDLHGVPHGAGFIGDSPSMQVVYRTIAQVARSSAAVFITGESGTGKELCAQAIHKQSARGDHPFITVHCASVPPDRIQSEIFGHVAGVFPGADTARTGAASLAEGGTLFLDEIMEMDTAMQSKLLRFVQTHSFSPVGSAKAHHADIRIICTTNRDPLAELRAGRLREDLFYRLYVLPIHMPPLRVRGPDICQIAGTMLQKYAAEEGKTFDGLDDEVAQLFAQSCWPGNVRQMQNLIRNIVVLHGGGTVTQDMLPGDFTAQCGDRLVNPVSAPQETHAALAEDVAPDMAGDLADNNSGHIKPLWITEKEAIERAIAICDGHIPRAARHLRVSPSTIYRKRQGWESSGKDKS